MSKFEKKFLFLALLTWGLCGLATAQTIAAPNQTVQTGSASNQTAQTESAPPGTTSPSQWIASLSDVTANLAPSQYTVSAISGSSLVIETDAALGFPAAKLYTFKLCLTHPRDKTPLKGAQLTLDGSSVPLKPQSLDDVCLTWTENVNYHFTAPARYVTFTRKLTIHRDSVTETIPFRFAINPWLHGESSTAGEIADFIKIKPRDPVAASKANEALAGKDTKHSDAPVIANDSRINFQELGLDSQRGGRFLFDFRINPQIEVINSAGQPVYLKLNQGEFEFEAYLLSTMYEGQNQIRRIVNPQPIRGSAILGDGALAFLQELTLPAIPSRGRLELAVVLKPKQTLPYLRVFKAIYSLGEYDDLKANNFARLKTGFSNATPGFNFEDYVGIDQPKSQGATGETVDGMRRLKYEFEPLVFKLTSIGKETATTREVYYQVRACVRNGTDNTPLRGYHFTITKDLKSQQSDLSSTVRMSEYDSCIYWDDRIDHKYYDKQQYFKAEYRIQNSDLNLDETLTAYVNPWDIALSRDARTIEADKINSESLNEKKVAPQLYLPSYKIQTRNVAYELDSLLRLQIKKQVHLLIDPQVLNYSHLSKGIDSREPLRDGIWKIRWAILHNRYETKEMALKLVSRGEFLTVATQGRITAPLELIFNDFRYIDSRNYFMIEIAPVKADTVEFNETLGMVPKGDPRNFNATVDTDCGLSAQSFIGPMIAGSDEEVGYLIPTPVNPSLAAFLPGVDQSKIQQNDALVFEKNLPTWDNLPEAPSVENPLTPQILNQWFSSVYLPSNLMKTWNLDESVERIALRRAMGPSAYTLKHFSEKYRRDLFMTEMLTRAFQRKELTAELEDRLCFYYFDQNPQFPIPFKSRWLPLIRSDYWLKSCLKSVGKKDQSFFQAQLETPIETITDVQYVGSTSSSLNFSAGFNVSRSESNSLSNSISSTLQAGLSFKWSEVLSLSGNTSYSVSRNESKSKSSSNSFSVSSGVNLNVRKLTLKVSGTHSQQCLTVALNPALYKNAESRLLIDAKAAVDSPEYVSRFLTQKARFCFTEEIGQPFQTQENFYFIIQDPNGVGFIDAPNILNRPLLLQLRGNAAYENFLRLIDAKSALPNQGNSMEVQKPALDDRLIHTLQLAVPSFPGILVETLSR